jgi:hypothetical protein
MEFLQRLSPSASQNLFGFGMFSIGVGVGLLVSEFFDKKEEVVEPPENEQLLLPFEEGWKDVVEEAEHPVNVVVVEGEIPTDYQKPRPDPDPELIAAWKDLVEDKEIPKEEPEPFKVLAASKEWNYEVEKLHRHGNEPYALHVDEFMANEEDLEQITLTYYEDDDIMTDPLGVPVYSYLGITGPLQFGHGTNGEEDYYYVRNPGMRTEYEIIREHDSYASAVLGIERAGS